MNAALQLQCRVPEGCRGADSTTLQQVALQQAGNLQMSMLARQLHRGPAEVVRPMGVRARAQQPRAHRHIIGRRVRRRIPQRLPHARLSILEAILHPSWSRLGPRPRPRGGPPLPTPKASAAAGEVCCRASPAAPPRGGPTTATAVWAAAAAAVPTGPPAAAARRPRTAPPEPQAAQPPTRPVLGRPRPALPAQAAQPRLPPPPLRAAGRRP
mmetsp:Transcript_86634/g.278138  ORF Transcript_86634/g.278138 Transcript_86634/m.278138 type:complete len:212 (+) Transcript_86634:39-674(+)